MPACSTARRVGHLWESDWFMRAIVMALMAPTKAHLSPAASCDGAWNPGQGNCADVIAPVSTYLTKLKRSLKLRSDPGKPTPDDHPALRLEDRTS
jgi:hypothetical protein